MASIFAARSRARNTSISMALRSIDLLGAGDENEGIDIDRILNEVCNSTVAIKHFA